MEGKISENTICYQQQTHHRQRLHKQISGQTIDKLQINANPSYVSRKAYKSVYQEQLQKQIHEYNKNKQWEKTLKNAFYVPLNRHQKNQTISQSSSPNKFIDYEKAKALKVQIHINNNYDGDSGFFRASQQWDLIQKQRVKDLRETLHKQIQNKKLMQFNSQNMKKLQNQTYNHQQQMDRYELMHQKQMQKQAKQNNRKIIQGQIEDKIHKRQRHSLMQYNTHSRHNPITNPIEYHIKNPYIPKKIQDKTIRY